MDEILDKLADYILSLRKALEETNVANERPSLTKHLAAAAEMFALLHVHETISVIENIVEAEKRGHGWSFISGENGTVVAEKWVAFGSEAGFHL